MSRFEPYTIADHLDTKLRVNSAPSLQRCEEVAHTLNRYPAEAPQSEQVRITAQDDVCTRRSAAFQDAVIRRISVHGVDGLSGRDAAGDHAKLLVRFAEFIGRAMEFVFQDAEGFFKDGFGNREIDVTVRSQVKQLLRLSTELDGAHENIRIGDDPLHEGPRDS